MSAMTHTLTVTTNLQTGRKHRFVDGKRVSQERFDEYRSIGCFFTESTDHVRRFHAVGVRK
jgi:hypothetical protein